MASDVVVSDQLIELGYQPTTREYLRDLWGRREFAVFLPYQDIRVQKMDTVLGQFWHFLNPAFSVFVYWVIFGLVLEIDRGIDNFIAYLVIGVLTYSVTTRVVSDAVNAMRRDEGLIRSVQFPRAVLPLSSVLAQTMAFVPAVFVMMAVMPITGETPSLRWLLLPVSLLGHFLVNLGLALMFARAGYAVRDLEQITTHIFRLLFYASAVIFLPSRFVEDETLVRLFALNPIYDALMLSRWVLMDLDVGWEVPVGLAAWALLLPPFAFVFFIRAEHRYGA